MKVVRTHRQKFIESGVGTVSDVAGEVDVVGGLLGELHGVEEYKGEVTCQEGDERGVYLR